MKNADELWKGVSIISIFLKDIYFTWMTVFAKKLQGAVNAYWIQPWRDHDIQQIIEYFLIYFLKKQEKQYSYVKYSEE